MGFIGGGRKRKRKAIEAYDDLRKRMRLVGMCNGGQVKFENLPIEVVQYVFILSGNFALVECSKALLAGLSGSKALNYQMLQIFKIPVTSTSRGAEHHGFAIPAHLCTRRFVTVELLKQVGIRRFYEDSYASESEKENKSSFDESDFLSEPTEIPHALVARPMTPRRLDLLEYMLSCYCRVTGATQLMEWAVQEQNLVLVQKYLSLGIQFDHRALILALELSNQQIANTLVSSQGINLNDIHLWECVFKKKDSYMLSYLRNAGGIPPYEALAITN
jgi:hypothetical protein